jgi:phosphoesterase RecJ-like protein
MGKDVRVVNHDQAPSYLASFPAATEVEVADTIDDTFDAAIVLECGSLGRTEISGLDRSFVINIDHHVGNTMYGDLNWFDATAAACGEMVFDVLQGLGATLTPAIATHLYVAILTDTGSFRHSTITTRTFGICAALTEAGVAPTEVADRVYQNSSVGKLRLTGTLLDAMDLVGGDRVAVLYVDDRILKRTGSAPDDLEGLINMPLAAQSIQAVVMFKEVDKQLRVSLRSKVSVNVRAVATLYGGGGHKNAAGFAILEPDESSRPGVIAAVITAVESVA